MPHTLHTHTLQAQSSHIAVTCYGHETTTYHILVSIYSQVTTPFFHPLFHNDLLYPTELCLANY